MKQLLNKKRLSPWGSLLHWALLLALGSASLYGASNTEKVAITDEVSVDRIRMLLSPEYTTMTSGEDSLFGFGAQGVFLVGITDTWQLGLAFRQSFSGDGLVALFTEIDLRSVFAITGSMTRRHRLVSVNGDDVYISNATSEGGLRAAVFASQYFFNLESSVLPLTGLGVGMHYEIPSQSALNYVVGARMDYISSGRITFYPIQLYAGVTFWL